MNGTIGFSDWRPWEERDQLPRFDLGGVYLIAAFAPGKVAVGPADPLAAELVYVGKTERTLKQRLSRFQTAAYYEKPDYHWGGLNYYWRKNCLLAHDLYVASLLDAVVHNSQGLLHLESDLLAKYERYHGHLPLCNQPRTKWELERLKFLRNRKSPDGLTSS